MRTEYDREKFKDAMHYVIWRAGDRPGFGATKLYKVLWFAEARMFTLHGRGITGATYIRQEHGPVPRAAMPIRDELAQEGRVRIWQDRYGNRPMWRFKSLTMPPLDRFSAEERATLDWWAKHIDEEHTATSISEESHDYGWEIAAMGEPLPLHAFLAKRVREPEGEELDWARSRARDLGLH